MEQTDEELMELVQRQHQLVEDKERQEREKQERHEKLERQALQPLHRLLVLHTKIEVDHPKYSGGNYKRRPIGELYTYLEETPQIKLCCIGGSGQTTICPYYDEGKKIVMFEVIPAGATYADRMTQGQVLELVAKWLVDLQHIPAGT